MSIRTSKNETEGPKSADTMGSCSTSGIINLNWRLLMAPPEVIDYLVVHELAHLTEQNHGREFWRLVGEYIPGHKGKAEWLEENSAKLVFSEEDL